MKPKTSQAIKLVLLFIGLFIFWSFVTPAFEGPDEQAHFATVNFLVNEDRLPKGEEYDLSAEEKQLQDALGTFRDRFGNNKITYHPEYRINYTSTFTGEYEDDILNSNTRENKTTYVWKEAARYPILYYLYSSIPYRLVYSADIFVRLFMVRIGSILLGVALVAYVYKSSLLFFEKKSYAVTASLMIAIHPMISFTYGGVNSDNLHNLLYTIFLFYCLNFVKYGWEKINILLFSLVMIADFYTKPQAYVMAPILFLAFGLRWFRTNKFKSEWKKAFILGCITLIGIIPKEGNTLLGFIWKGNIPYSYAPKIANNPPDFWEFVKFSANKLYAQNLVWYWGLFKWLGVVLPRFWWWIANRLVILSGLGIFVGIYKKLKKSKKLASILPILFLMGASGIYMFAIFWFDWQYAKGVGYSIGVQARYYYPVISAHMILMLYGLTSLGWNNKISNLVRRGVFLFFVGLQLAGIYTLITSYYDLWPLTTFITQASQYKPFFAKGAWWYLWIALYVYAISSVTYYGLKNDKAKKTSKSH